jgi:hypothetical protein
MKWLKGREPEVVWDYDATGTPLHAPPLRTREDWIRAGEIVFDAPISWDAFEVETLGTRRCIEFGHAGGEEWPNALQRYAIRRKGKSRWVTALAQVPHALNAKWLGGQGAQGNNPFDRFEPSRRTADCRQAKRCAVDRTGRRSNFGAFTPCRGSNRIRLHRRMRCRFVKS